jgi:1-acyl-sn-glycerol-3-phosphate acyltransferase
VYKTIASLIIWPLASFLFLTFVSFYFLIAILIPPAKLYPMAGMLCRVILFVGGQWLKIEGETPPKEGQPYIYLFNHASMFDGFMIVAAIPHYVTAVGANKQFSWPIWGWIVKRYGVIPIKRKKLKEAIHSLDLAEKAINEGVSFLISPEGTRSLTGELGEFKKGPFHLAKNTGVTIIPVGLSGAFKAKSKPDWRIKPGLLTLTFGKPIAGSDYENQTVEELRDRVQMDIRQLIKY